MRQAGGSGDEEGPVCFICLDGSNDTDGPLRRDCVCRGDDAGYAHLKCLVEYAKSESMKLNKELLPSEVAMLRNRFTMSNPGDCKKEEKEGYETSNIQENYCVASTSGDGGDGIQGREVFISQYGLAVVCMSRDVRDMCDSHFESSYANIRNMNILCKSWTECRNCRHRYQKELAVDMANECVSFIDTTYPECRYLRVQSLSNKLSALAEMSKGPVIVGDFTSLLSPELRDEGRVIGRNIQSLFDHEPGLLGYFEKSILNCLGLIVFDGATKESAKEAIMYYEKLLKLYKANGNSMGIHHCESSIANVQFRIGEKDYCRSDMLKELIGNKADYEWSIARHGPEHEYTIFAGVDVAICLASLYRTIKAERLIRKLVPLSSQVLGPHHDTTKRAESVQERIIVPRNVYVESTVYDADGRKLERPYRALRYENDGMDIVIHGPSTEPESKQTQLTVPAVSVSPAPGTPVMVVGLDNRPPHYYGKIGDLREWNTYNMVYFDDKLLQPYKHRLHTSVSCSICHLNLSIRRWTFASTARRKRKAKSL